MAPRYMSDRVKLLLTLTVLMMFVISTASTKQSTSKKTEGDDYVIRNIGIKMCHLKCAEHGQCESIEYDIETLTCRVLRDESKIEKEGHVIPARSHSHVPTGSCTSSTCSFGQRCLKTRSGKEVCVQASTTDASEDLTPSKTVLHCDPHAGTTDASEDLTPSKTDPPAPVTTQDCDPHATPSTARNIKLFFASKYGNLQNVKRILGACDANINMRGPRFRWTPVMTAAYNGHSDVVGFLVGRGADVSLVDTNGRNILHVACMGGDMETVKLILSLQKLDINAGDNGGQTAVFYAMSWQHPKVIDLLVSRGAY